MIKVFGISVLLWLALFAVFNIIAWAVS